MSVYFFEENDKRNNLSHILLKSVNVENSTFNWRPFCFCCIISFFWHNLIKRWPIFVILVSKCSGKWFRSTKNGYDGSKCKNNFSTSEEWKNMLWVKFYIWDSRCHGNHDSRYFVRTSSSSHAPIFYFPEYI